MEAISNFFGKVGDFFLQLWDGIKNLYYFVKWLILLIIKFFQNSFVQNILHILLVLIIYAILIRLFVILIKCLFNYIKLLPKIVKGEIKFNVKRSKEIDGTKFIRPYGDLYGNKGKKLNEKKIQKLRKSNNF